MLGDLKDVLAQLNSPSDYAIIGGAALLGFCADAAINIVPIPIFSPGVCGVTAGGGALVVKRGWEAKRLADRTKTLNSLLRREANSVANHLHEKGLEGEAAQLRFECRLAEASDDYSMLKSAIEKAWTSL